MEFDLGLLNARIVSAGGIYEGNVYCRAGKIESIASLSSNHASNRVIDLKHALLLPGLVEPHTHLGPFNGFASDVESESRGAIGGGITSMMHFVTEKGDIVQEISKLRSVIEARSYNDIALIGVLMNSKQVDSVPECISRGIIAFKHYMSKPEFEKFLGWTYLSEGEILQSFIQIAKHGGLAMVHPENFEIIASKIAELEALGRQGLAAWEEARPWYCEHDHMMTAVLLASVAKVPLYVVHVSTGSFNEIVEEAKRRRVRLYLETNPAYLYFTKDSDIGVLGKVNPPIRGKEHREALWDGIRKGAISCLGSDHIACNRALRMGGGDIWSVVPGLHGLEMMLPIMLSEGYHKRSIPLETIVGVTSTNAASIFGLPGKGRIEVGSDADFCVADLNKEVKVTQSILHDGSDYTLYEGQVFKGWPIMTISHGELVMENGSILAEPGRGKALSCSAKSSESVLP